MSQCANCEHFSMQKASRDMARLRLGVCEFFPRYTYFSPLREHDCVKFQQADAGIVTARIQFIKAKGKRGPTP